MSEKTTTNKHKNLILDSKLSTLTTQEANRS